MSDDVRLIASLGSSFAAGPGIEPVVDKAAMRSGANYAHLLAERLGARLVDLSVSGATTATVLDEPQRMVSRRFPPQIEGVPVDADLVTITVGGNDLAFAASLLSSVLANRAASRVITRPLASRFRGRVAPLSAPDDIARAAAGMTRIVRAVQQRAPHARVMLVDYLSVLGPDTVPSPDVPLSLDEIRRFTAVQSALRTAFETAAAASGAELISASTLSREHALGSPEPYVFGYRGLRHLSSVFHPNPSGMRAIADDIAERLA